MPTTDRPGLVGMAIDCFLSQSYPPEFRELIIVDSGVQFPLSHRCTGLEPDEVRYERAPAGSGVGDLFERTIELARGDLLMFWADDDWHHPERIHGQSSLFEQHGAPFDYCGISPITYCDLRNGDAWIYDGHTSPIDGTSLFRRSYHDARGPIGNHVDTLSRFMMGAAFCSLVEAELYIATYHGGNLWREGIFKVDPFQQVDRREPWPHAIQARIRT